MIIIIKTPRVELVKTLINQIIFDRVKFLEIFENKFCDLFSKAKNGNGGNTSNFCHIEELDIAEASTLWSQALAYRKVFQTKKNDASWSHAVLIFVSDSFSTD